ncbi:MAG TPA: N-acetylmuramic acid 6-phosphate etherase [Patescibacteria group bacterium]|nr:N-acetylmuramic acid 6-phosphate etherase [Patescibacteria group bacterium]
MDLSKLATEGRNPDTLDIDRLSTLQIVERINREDQKIAAAVHTALPAIAQIVDEAVTAFQSGGRLIYLGAGTSGRLGILDASECPPTYGTPPELIQGLIAGGQEAVFRAVEGAEDSLSLAGEDLDGISLTSSDLVVGIAASGRTPYVIGGLRHARIRGCKTAAVVCSGHSEMEQAADITAVVIVGPEVIMGSTRMKAGTAQKMVLNMITTASMIRLGKVYSNLMIDVQATNAKLVERAKRIVALATGADRPEIEAALEATGGAVKPAVTMLLANVDAALALKLLQRADGYVAKAVEFSRG